MAQLLKKRIIALIDFFYPPFSRLMPLQTFRYAACGGGNTVLDIVMYSISYNLILHKHNVDLGFLVVKPHIMSIILAWCVSFPTGFFLMRNIVFTESTLHGRVQLFRYFVLVIICLLLNYVFIKLFVEQFHIYPTAAKILTTIIVVAFSYLTQKNFTFRAEQPKS
ncbi:MAG TPA: GtrA family protein [Puia sp.]|jgi:putative flippase GtrA|nr:GtrA family protein [Puia sp.]